MHLNTIAPDDFKRKKRKRKGRGPGTGNGKTAGKGHKGQNARSGGGVPAGFEGGQTPQHRRLPKFGFTSRKDKFTENVRLSELSKLDSDIVTLETLKQKGVINKSIKFVKIFLAGEISKPMTVQGLRVSKGARAAIEAAGGKVE